MSGKKINIKKKILSKHQSNILFSIIIPVYNADKYLLECLQSVLNQKYYNLEIIVIDDSSTDNSLSIIKSFSKKYSNIKIISNKKNEGVSACRNKGIRKAIGKYIFFLDSDDYLINNGLKKLAKLVKDNNQVNMVIFTHYKMKSKNKYIKSQNIFFNNFSENKINNLFKFYNNNFCSAFCWNYLFERNFLIKERLNFLTSLNVGEDRLMVLKSLCSSKKFIFYNDFFYCYRLAGKFSERMQKESFKVCSEYLNIINELCKFILNKELSKKKLSFLFNEIKVPLLEFIPAFTLNSRNEILSLSKIIKKNYNNFQLLKTISTKKSMFFFIIKYGTFEGLINYQNFIIRQIKLLIENLKFQEIYIFSRTMWGIVIANELIKSKYPIKGFFDNNKKFHKNYSLNLPIKSPDYLNNKSKKQISKILVVISNQEKNDIQSVVAQLKKYSLTKSQIVQMNFYNFT